MWHEILFAWLRDKAEIILIAAIIIVAVLAIWAMLLV